MQFVIAIAGDPEFLADGYPLCVVAFVLLGGAEALISKIMSELVNDDLAQLAGGQAGKKICVEIKTFFLAPSVETGNIFFVLHKVDGEFIGVRACLYG